MTAPAETTLGSKGSKQRPSPAQVMSAVNTAHPSQFLRKLFVLLASQRLPEVLGTPYHHPVFTVLSTILMHSFISYCAFAAVIKCHDQSNIGTNVFS